MTTSPTVTLKFALAQLYLMQFHVFKACHLLKTVEPNVLYRPGMVRLMINLILILNYSVHA